MELQNLIFFFFQAEDGIRDRLVTGVQTCALPIYAKDLSAKGKPVVIILHTEMGNGVDFMIGTHAWHGVAPNDEQLADALSQNPETLGDY